MSGLQRNVGLQAGGPLKRKAPLKKESKGLCAKKRAQRRAYATAEDASQEYCSACLQYGPVEHSHILTQGNHDKHRNNPLNWLQFGKWCSCHRTWEDNKALFAERFPKIYAESVRRMWLLEPAAARLFLSKNPAPATL